MDEHPRLPMPHCMIPKQMVNKEVRVYVWARTPSFLSPVVYSLFHPWQKENQERVRGPFPCQTFASILLCNFRPICRALWALLSWECKQLSLTPPGWEMKPSKESVKGFQLLKGALSPSRMRLLLSKAGDVKEFTWIRKDNHP